MIQWLLTHLRGPAYRALQDRYGVLQDEQLALLAEHIQLLKERNALQIAIGELCQLSHQSLELQQRVQELQLKKLALFDQLIELSLARKEES